MKNHHYTIIKSVLYFIGEIWEMTITLNGLQFFAPYFLNDHGYEAKKCIYPKLNKKWFVKSVVLIVMARLAKLNFTSLWQTKFPCGFLVTGNFSLINIPYKCTKSSFVISWTNILFWLHFQGSYVAVRILISFLQLKKKVLLDIFSITFL